MTPSNTECYKSFKNIVKKDFLVTHHVENKNFGSLIEPIFDEDVDATASPEELGK